MARAGATGGGRTYRGQTPVNWYAALVVIVVLGVLSVVFANYEYRNPSSAATTTTHPTTKTTWYAGITFDICGKTQPALASNETTSSSSTSSSQGFYTTGDGVITVTPKTNNEAGKNATLGKFITGYSGLSLTATHLTYRSGKTATTYKNGETCPKGTPDAGKHSEVQVTYWPSALTNKAKAKKVTGDPSTLRFTQNQLITVGFVPTGTKLTKNASVVEALLRATSGASTTTVTTGPTTAPSATATTAAPASTTTPPSTTAPTSTPTTAP